MSDPEAAALEVESVATPEETPAAPETVEAPVEEVAAEEAAAEEAAAEEAATEEAATEAAAEQAAEEAAAKEAAAKEAQAAAKKEAAARAEKKAAAAAAAKKKQEEEDEAAMDSRDHLNIVFIGHVDAGKSTIAGNLLYLMGMVDERTISKYESEAKEKKHGSWFLAFIMDTNEEERAKGKTVEVGRAYFATDKRRFTILDAPGHKNYVPNMIGGAAQADVGVLVISARKGEFEAGFDRQGQTREHATLAMTLGVRQMVVVINKMDEETVQWSKERYSAIKKTISSFLKGLGYKPDDIYFVPISGYTGANIKVPVGDACSWYEGPTLLGLLDTMSMPDRSDDGALRLPVLDRYRDKGCTVVMGKVEAGTISKGDKVVMYPNKQTCEIAFVELESGEVPGARAGENVNVGLKDIKESDVSQGFMLCDPEHPIPVVTEFEAQLMIIDTLPHKPIISAGYTSIIHVHTCTEEVMIESLTSQLNKKTRKPSKRPPTFVKKGDIVNCWLRAEKGISIELYETIRQLGRFTLRDERNTVAVGKVLRFKEEPEE